MAITKLLRIKECSRGNKAQHLKNNIRYILNPEKTQGGLNIGGNAGVTWDWVYGTMVENKRYWHKEEGSQGFHYVISFPPEAYVSMQTAHEVAQEFCDRLLGENYYYVYAIHDDKPHLHVHVTFDSVSRLTGLKYHSPHGDWEKRIQPITDAVCKKFGLPPLTYGEERVGVPYETWRENKVRQTGENTDPNKISWADIIRDDIDEAVRNCDSYASFLSYLENMHYQIRDGKYLSLKPYGKPKAVRSRSLGPGYGKEDLIARIKAVKVEERSGQFVVYGDVQAIRLLMIGKREKNRNFHLTPFQRQFYYRWRNTCFIRRPEIKDAWKYKKDVVRLRELSAHITYLLEHDIGSPEELAERRTELEKERKAAGTAFYSAKRKLYWNPIYALVRERKKLLENGSEDMERIRELERQIQESMPLSQALGMYEAARSEYDSCRLYRREVRREVKLVDGILDDYTEERLKTAAIPVLEERRKIAAKYRSEPDRRL